MDRSRQREVFSKSLKVPKTNLWGRLSGFWRELKFSVPPW